MHIFELHFIKSMDVELMDTKGQLHIEVNVLKKD
jgi:hypothetical protein